MTHAIRTTIGIIAVVLAISIAVAMNFHSTACKAPNAFDFPSGPPEIVIVPDDNTQRQIDDLTAQQDMACWAYWMLASSTLQAIVGLFGLGALIVTLKQGRDALAIAQKTVRVTQDVARQELRPYVAFDHWEWGHAKANSKSKKVSARAWFVVWKNSGQTPAQNVSSWLSADFFPHSATPESVGFPDLPPFNSPASPLGPGQLLRASCPLDLNKLDAAYKGQGRFFYWGWIEYDGFEGTTRHRTEICAEIIFHGDPLLVKSTVADQYKTSFNAMDAKCVRQPQ